MKHQKRLSEMTVGILGLGLMGGSLAKALRGHCRKIIGWDLDPVSLMTALTEGVVDAGGAALGPYADEVDFLVMAVPVETIQALIPVLPEVFTRPVMVMDLGSAKSGVMRAFNGLPPRFDVLGGHPMCGKAQGGFESSEAGLYRGAVFALVASERTTGAARSLGEALVTAVGARALWLSASVHDQWAAGTSHLPYLVSCVLADVTPEEAAPLIGPGFRSTTRLAGTPLSMMGDILCTNRENILARMDAFLDAFQTLRDSYASRNDDAFFDQLSSSAQNYERLIEMCQKGSDHAD
jgi:prephenate dehydrogenase